VQLPEPTVIQISGADFPGDEGILQFGESTCVYTGVREASDQVEFLADGENCRGAIDLFGIEEEAAIVQTRIELPQSPREGFEGSCIQQQGGPVFLEP